MFFFIIEARLHHHTTPPSSCHSLFELCELDTTNFLPPSRPREQEHNTAQHKTTHCTSTPSSPAVFLAEPTARAYFGLLRSFFKTTSFGRAVPVSVCRSGPDGILR